MSRDRRRSITMTNILKASCSSWSSSQKGGGDGRIFGRQAGTQHRLHCVEVPNLEMNLVMVIMANGGRGSGNMWLEISNKMMITALKMEKVFLNV